MTIEQLREAYRAHAAARGDAAEGRRGCPAPETLEQLARGPGRDGPDLATFDHVLTCQSCTAEFDLLRAIVVAEAQEASARGPSPVGAAGDARDDLRAPVARSPTVARPPRVAMRRWAMAAALVLAAGLGGEAWRRTRAAGGEGEAPVVRGDASEVTVVAPTARASQSFDGFTWRAMPGAGRYVVEALDTLGSVLFSRATSDTLLVPTAAERTALAGAGSFDWMVTAQRGDGNERRSPLTRVQLTDAR
ncbi:MAG: hypothetical protein IPK33_18195 [Gemmatimonadetes bacterium]|nr:hypothetical protein [Gemmatimonadota bacterium]